MVTALNQAGDMESQDQGPNSIRKVNTSTQTCRNCGGTHPHKVCQHWFKATVDTGATIKVVDQETFAKMVKPYLKKTSIKAFAFDAKLPVRFVSKFEATIETRKCVTVATFYVTKTTTSGNLISATTAQDLGLISIHLHKISGKTGHH